MGNTVLKGEIGALGIPRKYYLHHCYAKAITSRSIDKQGVCREAKDYERWRNQGYVFITTIKQ